MTLLAALARHAPQRLALVGEREHFTVGQLTAQLPLADVRRAAADRRCAIVVDDPVSLARGLIALDGAARSVVLISATLDAPVRGKLIADSGSDLVLTDLPAGEMPPDCTVVSTATAFAAASAGPSTADLAHETAWMIATSGTTGEPKLVSHTMASLCRRIGAQRDAETRIWGQLYDACRFAGLQLLLRALVAGETLVCPTTSAGSLSGHLAMLAAHDVNAVSATPTLWRKIMMLPNHADLRLSQITLGGEIVDGAILRELAQRYPQARIVHIYASTEAGVGFSVTDGREGFPLSFLTKPPAGITLAIRDDRLFVHNPLVSGSYVGTEATFSNDDGFVDTQDRVEVRDDRVYFLGRLNGMINVGGNKLFPEEVERVLLDHPAIRLARVGVRRSPITGQLVTAEVVPVDPAADKAGLMASITAHCRAHLIEWKRPATIRILADLPVGAGGKLARGK